MESARKRKAPNAIDGGASKKIKLLNSASAPKSSVQDIGLKIVDQLRNAVDKNDRPIATEFFELPDRDDFPDYYAFTKLPVSLGTIEKKVKQNGYPTVTTLESDLKRMTKNAKDYNDTGSVIFDDAERIRKLVFNFMKTNNPAYKEDPKYTSFATPVPDEPDHPAQTGGEESDVEDQSQRGSAKPKRTPAARESELSDRKSSVAPSAATADADGEVNADLDLTGKSFQQAQQLIISHLLHFVDSEGLEIYSPFGNLPTRKLEDYYKLIRHPVSLKSVAKRAQGIHGRAPPTNMTDFKTWDAFEEEMSFIWRNAQEYNEDGSEMYNLATEFKGHFQDIMKEAREKVEGPAGPKLKIGGPKPKVMLNLSQHRESPVPAGTSIDSAALARQRQAVQAGVNGHPLPHRNTPSTNGLVRSASDVRPASSANSGSPPAVPAVKGESRSTQSPGPAGMAPALQPLTTGTMPPPTLRPSSSSPYPSAVQPFSSHTYQPLPALLPPTQIRTYPLANALLPDVKIATHPQLKISHPFSLSVPPHAALSHQSTTVTLPPPYYFVQISPTISKELSMGRPYKVFVTVNGTRLTQRDTVFDAVGTGRRTHVYEGSLAPGVNRVEVEVAAAKEDGKGLDVEKTTIFANLMRQ